MSSKEDLVDSARSVMAEKGYSRTRISDIVDKAGVAKGTFYLYFKSKEGILEELIRIIRSQQERLLSAIDHDISQQDPGGFTEELEFISNSFKDFYSKNVDIFKIIREELPHSSLVRFESDNIRKNAKRVIVEFLEVGRKAGYLKDMDYDIIAEIISMSLKEIIMNPPPSDSQYTVDEMFDQFIRLCLFGALKERPEEL